MALKHYKNSDSTVFNDAKALFDLNKNILLKIIQQVQGKRSWQKH